MMTTMFPVRLLPRLATVAALLLACTALLRAQAEVRGVWVARDGLTSRQKIISTLDLLKAANINLVCVDVWTRGYTVHPSDVLFAACGQRQDPDYIGRDPLAEFITEAHRRGIEVEAWFEYGFMFGWSGWYAGPTGIGPVLTANPTWIARDNVGNTQVSDGGTGFFTWASHEHPAVRQFLIDLATEVVDRYDVDGIQLDRIRYPSTSFGYDATTSAAYQAATGQTPPTNVNTAAWKRWRADRLNAFHLDIYRAIKAHRSTVRVSNAPTVWPGSYDTYLQDWPAWLSQGAIDLVYPQVYRTTASSYITTLDQQLAAVRTIDRARVAPGIRAISGTPTSEVLLMVGADRTRTLPGHVFWYAEGLYDDLPLLTSNYFQQSTAMPLQPAGWRPAPIEREELDPTTTRTPGFALSSMTTASGSVLAIAPPSASASDEVTFSLPVPSTGLWNVLARVPTGGGYCAAAPHRIAHAAGAETVLVDQGSALASGWQELGTYWLVAGPCSVTVRAVPGQTVVADCVALMPSRRGGGAMGMVGTGTAGSLGVPTLSMSGVAALGNTLRLQAAAIAAGAPVVFAIGLQPALTPLLGGALYLQPSLLQFASADANSRCELRVALPFTVAAHGLPVIAQFGVLDPTANGGVALSPAAQAIVP